MTDAATVGSVREALGSAADALAAMGIETPRLDAELLLAEATGWNRARLVAESEAGVPAGAARRFGEMVRRRLRREPVAYILGRKGFRHLELQVDRRVLIPRPETELLVEMALELRPRRVLDLGTGSGAIALAIAAELPECEVAATDTSTAALGVARANAARLGLAGRVELIEGMLPAEPGEVDLVLANLPYVTEAEWGGLEPEVTEWEPREALLAGPDGLDVLRVAIPAAAAVAPVLALEVGADQAAAVGELLFDAGFGTVETRPDLAGIPRVVIGLREQ
ncbi:MAG TPA: peptide chain release factor N(5)-glutamine methyltransferase [Solirubrobacterales bacterium]|nr:peptide chain release factor N(5)-glutamine methyltransferase [Solirubrobacterales bacterium]